MKKRNNFVKVILLLGFILTSCKTNGGSTNPGQESNITKIKMDGDNSDWNNYKNITTIDDDKGDTKPIEFDIKLIKAFTNDRYFYLMIEANNDIQKSQYVQIDLDIDVNGDGKMDYMAVFRPRTHKGELRNEKPDTEKTEEEKYNRKFNSDNYAEGKVIEFKMPISLIENKKNFTITKLRIMKGICCGNDWKVDDSMNSFKVNNLANEREKSENEKYKEWFTSPFKGVASRPFIINATDSAISGARALIVNEKNTLAYIVSEFSANLSKVDIDPSSVDFGKATVLVKGLLRPTDLDVDATEKIAYVTTENGYDNKGKEKLWQINLETNTKSELNNQLGHPTNVILSQDEKSCYVVDMRNGRLKKISLDSKEITVINKEKITSPFPIALDKKEENAYILTEPARKGKFPKGDLLQINLESGKIEKHFEKVVLGAGSITLNSKGTVALISEFGNEGECNGSISAINLNPKPADATRKVVLVRNLCGAHDAKFNATETLIYFVEVDASRLSVIKVNTKKLFIP